MSHIVGSTLTVTGFLLLLIAVLHDVAVRTVPNRISAALLMIGIALRASQGDLLIGLACGLLVFGITYGFWRLGWMGGADVKLLTAASVFVPPVVVPTLTISTSLAGGVLALIYVLGSRLVSPRNLSATLPRNFITRIARCEMRRLRRRGPLPYAAAIAAGSWVAVASS